LRFAKPAPPIKNDTVQTGVYGPACPQAVPIASIGGGALSGLLGTLGSFIDIGAAASGAKETGEDCLFLDVLVPSKALKGEVKLPIVNWIYGGAYLMGSKEGMYDGKRFAFDNFIEAEVTVKYRDSRGEGIRWQCDLRCWKLPRTIILHFI
jgi:hypothetical protein